MYLTSAWSYYWYEPSVDAPRDTDPHLPLLLRPSIFLKFGLWLRETQECHPHPRARRYCPVPGLMNDDGLRPGDL